MSREITFQIEIVFFQGNFGGFNVTITDPSGNIIEKQEISTAINLIEQKPKILNVEVEVAVEVAVESKKTAKEKSLPETINFQVEVDIDKANIKTTIDETVCVSTRISETQARVKKTINNLSLVLTKISEEVIQFTQENGIDICEYKVDTAKRIFIFKFERKQEEIAEKLEILANAFAAAAVFIQENDIKNMAIMLAAIIFKNRTIISFVEP